MLLIEDETGVTEAKSNSGEKDNNTFKNDKGDLLLDQLAIVTILELGDTVDASSEDKDDGSTETSEEDVHTPAERGSPSRTEVSDHVVGESGDEDDEDNNLKDETDHGDGDTGVIVGASGHGTAGGLEGEADDIEGDEDPVEQLGLEARELGVKEVDGLGESDVDGSGIEDGSDSKTD